MGIFKAKVLSLVCLLIHLQLPLALPFNESHTIWEYIKYIRNSSNLPELKMQMSFLFASVPLTLGLLSWNDLTMHIKLEGFV
jgi:hypothetical protein